MPSIFQNVNEILNSGAKEAKRLALTILEHGIRNADPKKSIRRGISLSEDRLKVFDEILELSQFEGVWVLGAGKASYGMAEEIESILGDRITGGKIVTKYDYGGKALDRIETIEAGHPTPDENSLRAGKEILENAENRGKDNLVINLISGGGSALLCAPVEGINLEEVKKTNNLLLSCGASIEEINSVRKHISKIKGGKLLSAIDPARAISLIVSDVVGDNLGVIASGPTALDETTFKDARDVLERYSLEEKIPESVKDILSREEAGETLKPGKIPNEKIRNIVISSNDIATKGAAEKGEEMGLETLILSRMIEGESREAGIIMGGIVRDIVRSNTPLESPCLLISGGETTVTVEGDRGKGGPNQEFALGAALKIKGLEKTAVAAIDTDGTDGPTNVAGGIADGETVQRLDNKNIRIEDSLKKHDAQGALESVGDALITGPTGTNVNDLRVAVVL